MVITTSEKTMSLLEHINNKFVSQLYSNIQLENSSLGFFSLNNADQLTLCLHISEKPNIAVNKWGCWGTDYNTVVIKLICQGIIAFDCKHIVDLNKLNLEHYEARESSNFLSFRSNDDIQKLTLNYQVSTFQNCSTYLNEN